MKPTHFILPALTVERALGYAYAIMLTAQTTLAAALLVGTGSPPLSRTFLVLTLLQILLVPILFDAIIHDVLLPAPQVRIVAAGIALVWNVALAISWGIVAGTRRDNRGTLFNEDPSGAWSLFIGYAVAAAIMAVWVFNWWQRPLAARPRWEATLTSASRRRSPPQW